MNAFLLLKTKQAILDNPDAFDMDRWSCCIGGCMMKLAGIPINSAGEEWFLGPPCHKTESGERISPHQMLKLSRDEGDRLFYVSLWSQAFKDEWIGEAPDITEAKSPSALSERREVLADIAARRIDHFIATEGRE